MRFYRSLFQTQSRIELFKECNLFLVSQSNPCGQHLNKLLSLKGMVDLFVREIPEELYHSKYKNPVAVFDNG